MFFRTTTLFAIASVAFAVEPQLLRSNSQKQEGTVGVPKEVYLDEAVITKLAPAKEMDSNLDIGKSSFDVEKGIKCAGGVYRAKKGMRSYCKGGIKKKFSKETKTSEMREQLADLLEDQLNELNKPDANKMIMTDQELESLIFADGQEFEEGASKSIEFGGFMKAEWGCKLTFEKTKEGFSKKTECGMKHDSGAGKKRREDVDSLLDYFQ